MASGRCEHCQKEFEYRLIHNGVNNSAYAYCDRCSFTVHLDRQYAPIQKLEFLLQHPQRIYEYIDPYLKPCPCGGTFRHYAEPKCLPPRSCGLP